MNEFTINSFEEYLTTIRDNLGIVEINGKRVRRYFAAKPNEPSRATTLSPPSGALPS